VEVLGVKLAGFTVCCTAETRRPLARDSGGNVTNGTTFTSVGIGMSSKTLSNSTQGLPVDSISECCCCWTAALTGVAAIVATGAGGTGAAIGTGTLAVTGANADAGVLGVAAAGTVVPMGPGDVLPAAALGATPSKEMVTSVDVSKTLAACWAAVSLDVGIGEMEPISIAFSTTDSALGRTNTPCCGGHEK
jgi:hypothetical protein